MRQLLLTIGGIQLVAPPCVDPYVPLLLESGFVMAGPVKLKVMRGGACHRNVARLWMTRKSGIVGIGTGYALTTDGLWRRHFGESSEKG